jgi:SET domain-containing protein
MEIKESQTNGKGLYSLKHHKKNDVVYMLTGQEYDHPLRETIYVGNNKHVYDRYGMYMNHSFNPTTYISGYNVVAYCDINEGDELTFNYNDN